MSHFTLSLVSHAWLQTVDSVISVTPDMVTSSDPFGDIMGVCFSEVVRTVQHLCASITSFCFLTCACFWFRTAGMPPSDTVKLSNYLP